MSDQLLKYCIGTNTHSFSNLCYTCNVPIKGPIIRTKVRSSPKPVRVFKKITNEGIARIR